MRGRGPGSAPLPGPFRVTGTSGDARTAGRSRPRAAPCCSSPAVLLAACGAPAAAGTPARLTGDWELVEGSQDGAEVPLPPGRGATLLADGEAGGTSFCNSYSGTYRLDGTAVAFQASAAPRSAASRRSWPPRPRT